MSNPTGGKKRPTRRLNCSQFTNARWLLGNRLNLRLSCSSLASVVALSSACRAAPIGRVEVKQRRRAVVAFEDLRPGQALDDDGGQAAVEPLDHVALDINFEAHHSTRSRANRRGLIGRSGRRGRVGGSR